uniref:PRA1 family protein n=1 Tax=Ananas comosus var. bracteatus TaxID=296719 RepID=A0A6V7QSG6_ANACO
MASSAPNPPLLPISNPSSGAGAATAPLSGAADPPIATPAFRLPVAALRVGAALALQPPPLVGARRPVRVLPPRLPRRRHIAPPQEPRLLPRQLRRPRRRRPRHLPARHPFSLALLLALLAAWCFLYLFRPADAPLVLLGRSFSDRETLGALVLLSVFVVFLTSVGSLIISALMLGAALVCAHGAFRVPRTSSSTSPSPPEGPPPASSPSSAAPPPPPRRRRPAAVAARV